MAGPDTEAPVIVASAPPLSPAALGARTGGGNGSSTLRRDILIELRRSGATSPEQLAVTLGASRTGVLQQLRSLQAAGLVDRRTLRHGVGRPRHLYDVTPDAQVAFPSNYDGLAAGLLAAIGIVGGDDLVAEVFDARRKLIAAQMKERLHERFPDGAPLEERVRELAVIQDEQGYLSSAVIGADGTIRLQQCNCAIFGVATVSTSPCDAELALFKDVLGAEVVRESHIACGDRSCTYRISEA
ncbi:MAG TPA: winged helix-turn-helix transcriptional regulator [Candidatus Limnocylindrales bacterium]|nr:winged helix-turn-helix transcriptional regulator [Candidatus Limnocylindrales bacterium]